MTTTEITIATIDGMAKTYAAKRTVLSERVSALEAEILDLKRRRLPGIKSAAAEATTLQSDLRAAIEAAPQLFVKPKTYTLHGIKCGYQKGKGKLHWEDDAKVVEKIEKLFDKETQEILIVVTRKPSKDALANLPVADLRKLGVTVEATGEQVVVKATDSEIDKLVSKMLSEGNTPTEEE